MLVSQGNCLGIYTKMKHKYEMTSDDGSAKKSLWFTLLVSCPSSKEHRVDCIVLTTTL